VNHVKNVLDFIDRTLAITIIVIFCSGISRKSKPDIGQMRNETNSVPL